MMNNYILLLAGSAAAILLIVYSGFRALTRRSGVSVLQFVLGLAALILCFAAAMQHQLVETDVPSRNVAGLTTAGLLVVAGLIILLLERRQQVSPNQLSAPVVMSTGVLLGALVLVTPLTVNQIQTVQPQATVLPSQSGDASDPQTANTQAVALLVTNTPSADLMASGAANNPTNFVLTPLPTRYVPTTPTVTPNSALVTQCTGTVQNNLNLRAGAGTAFDILTIIPHSSRINLYAQNADATWLWVGYGGQTGWVSGDYIVQDGTCANLPQRVP